MYRYRAFGLNVASDIELPELLASPDEMAPTDLTFRCDPNLNEDGDPAGPATLRINIRGVGAFLVENGSLVRYRTEPGITECEVRIFLLGSCFGCVLQQRGYVVLHGNAISSDGRTCHIVVGNQGAGKSTRAAWHYLQGDRILADDICAITFTPEGRAAVIPSFPQIKLWQNSADLLGIKTQGLRRLRHDLEKFGLPIANAFQNEPAVLTEIIEIDPAHVALEPLQGMGKVAHLIHHSYRYPFVEKMGMQSSYRRKILKLAGMVKMQKAPRFVHDAIRA
jgi:hypothetical protein